MKQILLKGYFSEARTYVKILRAARGIDSDVSKFIEKFDWDNTRKSIISLLNYFEKMCFLLKRDLIEEDVLKDTCNFLFLKYYNTFRRCIEYRLDNEGKKLYEHYVDICQRWS